MIKLFNNMKKSTLIYIIIIIFFINCQSYCYDEVQTITITKEDIINADPTKSPVTFSHKDLKFIETMEKRHFSKTYPEFSDYERLKNLEYELLGRTWLYTDQSDRISRLKIASSNRMLAGTALPVTMSSRRTVKRLRNDSIQLRTKDDVGLIDGFLRLLAPEAYEKYRQYSDNMFNKYEY